MVKAAARRLPTELAQVVEFAGEDACVIAEEKIGVLQPDWDPLADSTVVDKTRLGFEPPDYDPLLRKGDLKVSFEWGANGLQAYLTSKDPVMFWHEYGTAAMPPRPVIGPAMLEAGLVAQVALGKVAQEMLEP